MKGFLMAVFAVLLLAPPAAGQCRERGWLLYAEVKGDDTVLLAGHGPLAAWGREPLYMDSVTKVTLDPSGMFRPQGTVEYTMWAQTRQEGFEPFWAPIANEELRLVGVTCKWASRWLDVVEDGKVVATYRVVFGNQRWLAGAGHRNHPHVERAETIEDNAPFWKKEDWK